MWHGLLGDRTVTGLGTLCLWGWCLQAGASVEQQGHWETGRPHEDTKAIGSQPHAKIELATHPSLIWVRLRAVTSQKQDVQVVLQTCPVKHSVLAASSTLLSACQRAEREGRAAGRKSRRAQGSS